MKDDAKKKSKWRLTTRILAAVLAVVLLLTEVLMILVRVSEPDDADINDETINAAYTSIRQGDEYLNASTRERVAIFLSNLGREPKTSDECEQIAAAYIGRGEYGEAIVLYEKSVALDDGIYVTQTADRYIRLGSLYVLNGEAEKAINYYEHALKLNKKAYVARLLLAQIYLDSQDYEKAERELADYLENQPSDGDSRRTLAMLQEGTGSYAAAREQYEILLEQEKKNADLLNCARLSLLLEDTGDCKSKLKTYFDKESKPAGEAYFLRSLAVTRDEAYENAISDMEKAMELGYSDKAQCYSQLTNLYYLTGDMNKAVEAGKRAESLMNTPDAALLQKIGLGALQLSDYETAIAYLGSSLDADPTLAENRYFRGIAYMVQGQYEEAGKDFDAAIEAEIMVQECCYNSAVCSLQLGDHAAARWALDECISTGGNEELSASAQELLDQIS